MQISKMQTMTYMHYRFENAMREKVANVTIPYWDNTIEEGLQVPRQSILFSPLFMGTANGQVTQGTVH